MFNSNIKNVPAAICVGCGACASICPKDVIKMVCNTFTGTFLPEIDDKKCSGCGLCLTVCPAISWANNTSSLKNNPFVGDYIKSYSAYTKDDTLRIAAASGGFTTGLLKSLFIQGVISGAVVSRRVKNNPFDTETFIARSAEEIDSCKGSIYSPVCFVQVFRELQNVSADETLAFVGLPCHVQALSLLIASVASFQKIHFLKISPVCGHTPTRCGYQYTLRKLGIDASDIVDIDNRGNGWPGFLSLYLKNGETKHIPYGNSLSWGMVLSSPIFTADACHVCPDPGGFASDIIVCDAWLPMYKNDVKGTNLILSKTEFGEKMILTAKSNNDIFLEPIEIDQFLYANQRVFISKTRNHRTAIHLLVGKYPYNFHRYIHNNKSLDCITSIKLYIYYMNIKIVKLFDFKLLTRMPKIILFYFKLIGMLKR